MVISLFAVQRETLVRRQRSRSHCEDEKKTKKEKEYIISHHPPLSSSLVITVNCYEGIVVRFVIVVGRMGY